MKTRRGFLQGSAGGALAALGVRGAPLPASASSGARFGLRRRLALPVHPEPGRQGRVPALVPQRRVPRPARPGSGRRAASCWSCCTTPRRRATRAPRSSSGWTAATTSARRSTSTPRPTSACRRSCWSPRRPKRPAPGDRRAARPRRVLPLGQGEDRRDSPDEHPVLTEFKQAVLRRHAASPTELARAGLRGGRHRHVLLGRAAHAARRRPGRLARAAARASPPERDRRVQPPRRRRASSSSAARSTPPGFTWPGVMFWDDVRTVDYLLTPAGGGPAAASAASGLSVGGLRSLPPGGAGRPDQGRGRRRLDGVVPGAAQAARPQHDRPHEARARAVPLPRLPGRRRRWPCRRRCSSSTAARTRCSTSTACSASFDKLAACYEKAGVPEQLRDAPLRHAARVQRRDAGRGLGLPAEASRPPGMSRFDVVSRRLANQQLAAPRLSSVSELVRWMGAVQAQDYRGGLWAIGLRLAKGDASADRGRDRRAHDRPHLADARDAALRSGRGRALDAAAAHAARRRERAGRHRELGLDDAAFARSARGADARTRGRPRDDAARGVCGARARRRLAGGPARHPRPRPAGAAGADLPRTARAADSRPSSCSTNGCRARAPRLASEALATLAERYFSSHGPATLRGLHLVDGTAA